MKNIQNQKSAVCFCFDTVNTITIDYENNEPLKECMDLCYEIERLMSRFKSESDIARINHSGGTEVGVNLMTAEIIQKAILYNKITNGIFDISIGAVSSLWNFGLKQPKVPDIWKIYENSNYVDSKKIIVNGNRISVDSGMQIDLGGIAKGYAADKIVGILKKYTVKSGYINLGGNIAVIGSGKADRGWRIGIQSPFNRTSLSGILRLEDKFISTSGIYERCFVCEHVNYHHILDTCTGMPVQNNLASVSLVTTNGALGDALATACICMGFEAALDFIKGFTQDNIEALFVLKDGSTYWHGRPDHFVSEARRREFENKQKSTVT